MKRLFALCLFLLIFPCIALGESLSLDELNDAPDAQSIEFDADAPDASVTGGSAAREDFIDRIIALAQELYTQAIGRAQRAQYSGDIYVCKNFTVHLFRETCGDFRMAEYPDVPLVIPNSHEKAD